MFLLEIITPLRVAYSDTVDMVTAPSASGIIGVLTHHTPLFTRLIEGEIKITNGKDEKYLAIGGGFMEVTKDRVSVLVSQAVHAHELNEEEIKKAQERAKQALAQNIKGSEFIEAQGLLRRSSLELKLLQRHRHRSKPSMSS